MLENLELRENQRIHLQDLHYTYSGVGNVLSIQDGVMSQTQTFSYDKMYRLLSAQASGNGQGVYPTEYYTYDPNTGNLVSKGSNTYTYGDPNHVHAVTSLSNGWNYQYDANGNMTQRYVNGQTFNLSYDAEGRMTGVSGAFMGSYAYNGDGQRVVVTEGVTTTVYVGNIFEWNATSQTFVKYYYAGASRIAMRQGISAPLFILGDHLGSTSVIANYNGSEHGAAGYKAWGETRFITGEVPTDYRFTGQKEHDELGLYFYNARWHDPILGRFVQADNLVFVRIQGVYAWDHYAYVNNNPVNFIDPSGNVTLFPPWALWSEPALLVPAISYGIRFTDDGIEKWTWRSMLRVMEAVRAAAKKFAEVLGGTPAEAFKEVYEYIEMRFCYNCVPNGWGWAYNDHTILFDGMYSNMNSAIGFVLHELGHLFDRAVCAAHNSGTCNNIWDSTESARAGLSGRMGTCENDPVCLGRKVDDKKNNWGFAGGYGEWQFGQDDTSGEVWADMFVAWVLNTWGSNPQGTQKSIYMNRVMFMYLFLFGGE